MWLTGFDAPCLHTMYVDKPMRGHGLMQAIARVNRVFKDKPGGLVVDYLGLADELKKALATYTESGGTGKTALDQGEAVAVMLEKYEVCRGIFHGFDYRRLLDDATPRSALTASPRRRSTSSARRTARSAPACRDGAVAGVRAGGAARGGVGIRDEVAFFQEMRAVLVKTTVSASERTPRSWSSGAPAHLQGGRPGEVVDIFAVAGLKKPDISILSDEFLAEVRGLPQKNLAVELLKKLLQDEIRTRFRKNVVQSRSFSELLEQALKKYQNRAIEAAQVIEELIAIAKEMQVARRRGEKLGLSEDEVAFYDALAANESAVQVLGNETLKGIAHELVDRVRNSVTVDWSRRESARAQLRVLVKRILRKYGYPPDKREQATELVLKQTEELCKEWVVS